MSDYDSDDNAAIDSDDDDVVEFVPTKKRFAYTTFGNDEGRDQRNGRDAATYGVFMDSDNDEDDRYTSRRRHHLNKEEKAPLFVKSAPAVVESSSNDAVAEKKEKEEAQEEPVDEAAAQEEKRLLEQQEAANARFLELLGRGRGKKRGRSHEREEPARKEQAEEEDSFMPAGLGYSAASQTEHVDHSTANQDADSSHMGLGMTSAMGLGMTPETAASFGLGAEKPRPVRVDPNLGKWEKHTKGIGMKLLTKMGYRGSGGLGSKRLRKKVSGDVEETNKGISRPVEVVVRPNNLGLGFGNFKEATKLKANRQIEAEVRGVELPSSKTKPDHGSSMAAGSSSALPSTNELLQQQSWRKGAASRKRPRRTIVSAAELLENQKKKLVVIDMRGPAAAAEAPSQAQEVPLAEELLHNVTLILNTYENKLHSTSHFVQSTERKIKSLQSDIDDMDRRKSEGQERIDKLQAVLGIMDRIDLLLKDDSATKNGDETTNKVQSLLQELGETFTAEEKSTLNFYGVLAPSLVAPLVQARLKEWDPLTNDPATSEQLLTSVLTLCNLGNDSQSGMNSGGDAMVMTRSLFENHVLPRVKLAFQSSKWNPMNNIDTSLALYEMIVRAAEKVSPPKKDMEQDEKHVLMTSGFSHDDESTNILDLIQEELIHDAIYPKLSRSVSQWKPSLDDTGLHLANRLDLWILPWLQHLDRRAIIPTLLSDVKRKLRSAQSVLQQKISDDESFFRAFVETLKPWKNVLKVETLQDLTSSSVTPRLGRYLAKLPLSRQANSEDRAAISILSHLCDLSLLSSREYLSLMEGELLPNWAETLHAWLSSTNEADMTNVAEYYFQWKSWLFHTQHSDSNGGTPQIPEMLLRNDSMICRFFCGGLAMIQAASQSDADALDELRPKASNYKVVLARRAKEDRIKAQEDLRKVELDANQDANGFASTVNQRKGESATFRDVVEDFARELDLSFHPRLDNRTIDGKQVFLFGTVPVYLDSNVVFALQASQWGPLSLEQLGTIAKNRVSN